MISVAARQRLKRIPGATRLARWLRRWYDRLRDPSGQKRYWAERRDMVYYQEALRLARLHAPEARSVIDVGSMNSPFILQFDWIPEKASLDLDARGKTRGVTNIKADFLVWQPDRIYDLVLCLQVLEHLEDPAVFCHRLFQCGRKVVVSVPYKWPPGRSPGHVQDPVDESKLRGWLGRPWIDHFLAKEPKGGTERTERLIVVLDGDAPGSVAA